MYRNLAIAAWLIAVVLLLAYLGACNDLVPGDTGGRHQLAAIIGAIVFAVFGAWCWRQRGQSVT